MNGLFTLASVPGFSSPQDGGAILVYVLTSVLIPALIAVLAKYSSKTKSGILKNFLDSVSLFLSKVKKVLSKEYSKKKKDKRKE